jgi:hypothetical protein
LLLDELTVVPNSSAFQYKLRRSLFIEPERIDDRMAFGTWRCLRMFDFGNADLKTFKGNGKNGRSIRWAEEFAHSAYR